jgi:hypothetical protein
MSLDLGTDRQHLIRAVQPSCSLTTSVLMTTSNAISRSKSASVMASRSRH